MPEPWEWTEEDIQRLIADQIQESLGLDYKRSEALAKLADSADKKEATFKISRDISAFANSAGGTLVYGVTEEESGGVLVPIRIDGGVDPAVISRERLEQVINSSIQRRVPGIRINQVPLNGAAPGRVLYVVHVPQSPLAPHMANNNRYYKRFNFMSIPMEEYEVRDVTNRQDGPDLFMSVVLSEGAPQELMPDPATGRSKPVKLRFLIENRSPYMSEHYIVHTHVDARLLTGNPQPLDHYYTGEKDLAMWRWSRNHMPTNAMPIWDDGVFEVCEHSVTIPSVQVDADYLVTWRVSAPRMNSREGVGMLRVRHSTASIENAEDGAPLDGALLGLE